MKTYVPFTVLLFAFLCSFFLTACKDSKEDIFFALEDSTQTEIVTTENLNETKQETVIYVHICGAVKKPGLYEIPAGSRVGDAVEIAGGFQKDAQEDEINLARQLEDGEQLKILTKKEAKEEKKIQTSSTDDKININTASLEQLTTLTGIGESRAQAIISYRESKGRFQKITDLTKVDGIKEGIYDKIKDKITV